MSDHLWSRVCHLPWVNYFHSTKTPRRTKSSGSSLKAWTTQWRKICVSALRTTKSKTQPFNCGCTTSWVNIISTTISQIKHFHSSTRQLNTHQLYQIFIFTKLRSSIISATPNMLKSLLTKEDSSIQLTETSIILVPSTCLEMTMSSQHMIWCVCSVSKHSRVTASTSTKCKPSGLSTNVLKHTTERATTDLVLSKSAG